jgi:hypothetical protein
MAKQKRSRKKSSYQDDTVKDEFKGKYRNNRKRFLKNKQNKEDMIIFAILILIITGILSGYYIIENREDNDTAGFEQAYDSETSKDAGLNEFKGSDNEIETAADDQINTNSGTNGAQRTVIVETFTSVDCYWCNAEEEPALKRIARDYGRDEVVILAYHGFYGNDPYETTKGNKRASYYGGVSGTPNVWIDGTLNKVGGTGQGVDAMYNVYTNYINQRAPISSPISISLTGLISGSTAQLTVKVDNIGDTDSTNLNVRIALFEDGLQYDGKTFDWVLRDFTERLLSGNSYPLQVQESFVIDSDWNPGNLGIIAFVQDDRDKEVQQSVYFKFD